MIPTRETSGLVVTIDKKGRMRLIVNGHKVVGITEIDTHTEYRNRGTMTFTLLTQFVTFEHVDRIDPEVEADAD